MIAEMAALPPKVAETIASADNAIDSRFDTTSWNPSSREELLATAFNTIAGTARDWHFPNGDQLARAVDTALSTYDAKKLGESLHVIQDSFSHFGFKWNHVFATAFGKDPDNPKNNMRDATDMAMLSLDMIRAFKQRTEALLKKVQTFVIQIAFKI